MKKSLKFLTIPFIILYLTACGSIKPIQQKREIRPEVAKHLTLIKKLINNKKYEMAEKRIRQMVDKGLLEEEKASKYNLWGMILFSQKKYAKSIELFDQAAQFDIQNEEIEQQININLASAYFKTSEYEKSFDILSKVKHENLNDKNFKKIFFLKYILAKQLNRPTDLVESLIYLVSKIKDRNELINNRNYKSLTRYFSLLNYEQKISMLKQFETSNYTVIPHLAVHLAMDLKRVERFDESNEIVFWVKRHFSDYGFSIEKYFDKRSVHEPIQKNTIGLVLPLSGDKAKFGQKVLLGISLANSELEKPYDLIIRDSQGSSQVASYQIKDLVQNFQVSLIVGGLFSDTAKKQYLTADKLGVTFISLAPVYISKKRKTVLLVEVPGSVESQVAALMASVEKGKLGDQYALLYPDDTFGHTYLDAFWEKKDGDNNQLISLSKFDRNITDYREPVKNLVGLKFLRERQEEYKHWAEIYKLKVRNIKRIQVLKPEVHFDWVFIPSFPHEIIQIIPSFQYVDAKKLVFVGGPSWMSSKLVKRIRSLGNIKFVGNLNEDKTNKVKEKFLKLYNQEPRLLESIGYDSIFLVDNILARANFGERSDFINYMKEKDLFKSFFSAWSKKDQLWIKNMRLYDIKSDGVRPTQQLVASETN